MEGESKYEQVDITDMETTSLDGNVNYIPLKLSSQIMPTPATVCPAQQVDIIDLETTLSLRMKLLKYVYSCYHLSSTTSGHMTDMAFDEILAMSEIQGISCRIHILN